ncbi:hypothetical protein [Frigidibacter oleivorans]|uniref:hypothetical protein n=1 Tax=Frigidibacter oleivorans TaxID=2487129 RepID=UPI000F8E66BE|nr:hypothetical protein [Frigidibacter oleivorans]
MYGYLTTPFAFWQQAFDMWQQMLRSQIDMLNAMAGATARAQGDTMTEAAEQGASAMRDAADATADTAAQVSRNAADAAQETAGATVDAVSALSSGMSSGLPAPGTRPAGDKRSF